MMNPFDEDDYMIPSNPFDVDIKVEGNRVNGMATRPRVTQQFSTAEEIVSHWKKLDNITSNGITDPFDIVDIKNHLNAMGRLVAEEQPHSSGRTGDCLEFLLSEDVIEKVYALSLRERTYSKDLRLCILNFFVELLSSTQPLLIHQQLLRPLTKLLHVLEENKDEEITAAMIPVLHQICVMIHDNPSLLDLFYMDGRKSSQSKCLVFVLLIAHIHETSSNVSSDMSRTVGSRSIASCSREAVLSFLSLAKKTKHKGVAMFITDDTSFCPVLAASLSAMYSELPTSQPLVFDEWSSVTTCVRHCVPNLTSFVHCLQFCNSVIQVSPYEVTEKVLTLIHDGFLQQVLVPALFQKSEQALVFSTAYLNILLSTVTAPPLMRVLLQLLVTGSHDNEPLLDALVGRVECVSELCSVSLELLHILVDLNCEDVMLELVLKYLLHGGHVKLSHVKLVGLTDVYGQFSAKVIDLRPKVCVAAENLYIERVIYGADSVDGNVVGSGWFKKKPFPSNPSNTNIVDIAYISIESSYYIQLYTARKAIEECAKACKCWSSSYEHCTASNSTARETVSTVNGYHGIQQHSETITNRLVSHKKKRHSTSGVYFNTKAGVFVKVLFEKLSRMLGQSPKVNLLVTKLISRLCHYPHPLMRSYLLHHNITLLPAVPDLSSVLTQLSDEITDMGHREEGLELRLARARKTMIARADQDLCPAARQPSEPHHSPATTPGRTQNGGSEVSITNLTKPSEDSNGTPESAHHTNSSPTSTELSPSSASQHTPKQKQKKIGTSKLYSIIIFDEFLKELAAISQEQSIISPISYTPIDDT